MPEFTASLRPRAFSRCAARARVVLAATAAIACVAPFAHADRAIDRVNDAVTAQAGERGIVDELFPALAEMNESPMPAETVDDLRRVFMVNPGSEAWDDLLAWATRPAQEDALAVFEEIFSVPAREDEDAEAESDEDAESPDEADEADAEDDEDTRRFTFTERLVFDLPYTEAHLDESWVEAGLAVVLGDEQRLVDAEFAYTAKLHDLFTLINAHAAAAADAGDGERAFDLVSGAVRLNRTLKGRQFYDEVVPSFNRAMLLLDRAADLAYTYPESFDEQALASFAESVEDDAVGMPIRLLPIGEQQAVRQLIGDVFDRSGEIDGNALASTLASLHAGLSPYRLLAEAGHGRQVAKRHAGERDTTRKLDNLYGDWQKRWELDQYTDLWWMGTNETEYELLDSYQYGLIKQVVPDYARLFELRTELRNMIHGTRAAIGVQAFIARNDRLPPNLSAVSPSVISTIGDDLYHQDQRLDRNRPMYFRTLKESDDPLDILLIWTDPDKYGDTKLGGFAEKIARGEQLLLPERKSLVNFINLQIIRLYFQHANLRFVDYSKRPGDKDRVISVHQKEPNSITQASRDQARAAKEEAMQKAEEERLKEMTPKQRRDYLAAQEEAEVVATPEQRDRMIRVVGRLLRNGLEPAQLPDVTAAFYEWYAQTEAGRVFQESFDFPLELIAEGYIEQFAIFFENDLILEGVDLIRKGEEPTDEQVLEFDAAYEDQEFNAPYLKAGVFIAQARADEINTWARTAFSSRAVIDVADLAREDSDVFVIDPYETDAPYVIWSVGEDGQNDRLYSAGPGGADIMYWPPLLSVERATRGE